MKKKLLLIIVLVVAAILATVITVNGSRRSKYNAAIDLGHKYLSEMKFEEAISSFQEALAINAEDPQAIDGMKETYIAWGRSSAEADDWAHSIECIDAALSIDKSGDFKDRLEKESEEWIYVGVSADDYDKQLERIDQLKEVITDESLEEEAKDLQQKKVNKALKEKEAKKVEETAQKVKENSLKEFDDFNHNPIYSYAVSSDLEAAYQKIQETEDLSVASSVFHLYDRPLPAYLFTGEYYNNDKTKPLILVILTDKVATYYNTYVVDTQAKTLSRVSSKEYWDIYGSAALGYPSEDELVSENNSAGPAISYKDKYDLVESEVTGKEKIVAQGFEEMLKNKQVGQTDDIESSIMFSGFSYEEDQKTITGLKWDIGCLIDERFYFFTAKTDETNKTIEFVCNGRYSDYSYYDQGSKYFDQEEQYSYSY